MKKIAIDMDDVICDGGYIKLVNKFLKKEYTLQDVKGYYIQDLIPEERMQEWKEFYNKHNLYEHVQFLPDAYEVIKKLNEHYEVYVLTAYVNRDFPENSGKILEQKYEWLYNELPFLDPNKYIFTTNKENIKCDIRIDDKLSNLEGEASLRLLFSAYHNLTYTLEELKEKKVVRVNNWKEIEKMLI